MSILLTTFEQEILSEFNRIREKAKLPDLSHDEQLLIVDHFFKLGKSYEREHEISCHSFVNRLFGPDFNWAQRFFYSQLDRIVNEKLNRLKRNSLARYGNALTLDVIKLIFEDLGLQLQNHLLLPLISMQKLSHLQREHIFEMLFLNRAQAQDIFALLAAIFPVDDRQFDFQMVKLVLVDIFLCAFPTSSGEAVNLVLENFGCQFFRDDLYRRVENLLIARADKNNSQETLWVGLEDVQSALYHARVLLTQRQVWILFLYAGLFEFQKFNRFDVIEEIQNFLSQKSGELLIKRPAFKVNLYSFMVLLETPISLRMPLKVKEILLELRASQLQMPFEGVFKGHPRRDRELDKFRPTLPLQSISVEEKRYSTKDYVTLELRLFRIDFSGCWSQMEQNGLIRHDRLCENSSLKVSNLIYKKLIFRVIRNNLVETLGMPLVVGNFLRPFNRRKFRFGNRSYNVAETSPVFDHQARKQSH